MKRNLFLLCFTVSILACEAAYAQPGAGTFLYIPTYTANTAIAGHTNEVRLNSVQFGVGLSVASPRNNPNPDVSEPSTSEIVISKNFDISSLRIQNALLKNTRIGQTGAPDFLEIRYYNGTAINAIYTIRLDKAVFSGYSSNNSLCTSGCPDVVETISVAAINTITYRNLAVTPNQVLIYNLVTNTTTFTE